MINIVVSIFLLFWVGISLKNLGIIIKIIDYFGDKHYIRGTLFTLALLIWMIFGFGLYQIYQTNIS